MKYYLYLSIVFINILFRYPKKNNYIFYYKHNNWDRIYYSFKFKLLIKLEIDIYYLY